MKNFMKEFKEFIARGDVMSMAVGIIIGGAFTSIVNSLVGDIITPLIGMVTGGIDFTGLCITFGDAKLMVGNFIQSIIIFLITAFVVFTIMRLFNDLQKLKPSEAEAEAEPEEPEPTVEEKTLAVLEEIRDHLAEH